MPAMTDSSRGSSVGCRADSVSGCSSGPCATRRSIETVLPSGSREIRCHSFGRSRSSTPTPRRSRRSVAPRLRSGSSSRRVSWRTRRRRQRVGWRRSCCSTNESTHCGRSPACHHRRRRASRSTTLLATLDRVSDIDELDPGPAKRRPVGCADARPARCRSSCRRRGGPWRGRAGHRQAAGVPSRVHASWPCTATHRARCTRSTICARTGACPSRWVGSPKRATSSADITAGASTGRPDSAW